ncbi:UNVERIFIED_CONTAM: hypothetical protein FKN15_058385 [Acipenser sinensis]
MKARHLRRALVNERRRCVEHRASKHRASSAEALSIEVRAPSVEASPSIERRVSRCMHQASRCVHRASRHRRAEASSIEVRAPSVEAPKHRASRCVHRVSSVEVRAPSVEASMRQVSSVDASMRRASSAEASSVEVRALSAEASSVEHPIPSAEALSTKRRSAAPSGEALTPKEPEREHRSAGTERGTLAQTPTRQLTRRAEMLSAGTVSDAVQYLPDGAGDFSR